ncbi:hypothetical protein P9228_09810 [Mesorhizobium sp. WSM4898]|uniref:hypothetical protein n=1 Tax=Mesorhizobium sp. WSM4898 TaxID=3038544 RepID=UPI0024157245|nr:hypothetical protein [Mesorhizobium sp. WSM4898]MDG4906730.1 hypothetical protein [Mesorhizobium sp. WSM4898]
MCWALRRPGNDEGAAEQQARGKQNLALKILKHVIDLANESRAEPSSDPRGFG